MTELTRLVKKAIDAALPRTLRVLGEISNYKPHGSGHVYFTLKDAGSELSCVMWRSAAALLKFKPSDGMEVIATGSVDVFERSGRYQLYVQRIEPRGVGALELAFRQLKDKLEREGLFDPARKQPLPKFPSRIALVTSPTGAAVRDMLRTLSRSYPCVEVLLVPVRVQGEGAAREIAEAIRRLNLVSESLGGVDVMIVGRGGGSLEDLWAFNEELVARAVFASRVPVISGVGHEVDVTICDLVADVRAATPTAAAELAVPVLNDVQEDLGLRRRGLSRAVRALVELETRSLRSVAQRSPFREPRLLVRRREQVLDERAAGMSRELGSRIHELRRRLDRVEPIVQRLAPHAWLASRGTRLHERSSRLHLVMARRIHEMHRLADQSRGRLERASPLARVLRHGERTDYLHHLLKRGMTAAGARRIQRVAALEQLLAALSYRSVLGRGYTITRLKRGREVVRDADRLRDGDRIITEFRDGETESQVVNRTQRELFED
ncbi:MAG: exodeoxyribonuclease VII large subunit [Phycisphaerales bacterium]|nr:exodeoxyribonuclease VII large subunit [Phycisphaerales bacterium]